jgi:hypothetical protein
MQRGPTVRKDPGGDGHPAGHLIDAKKALQSETYGTRLG